MRESDNVGKIAEYVDLVRRDPVVWLESLGDKPWAAQQEIIRAVAKHRDVAVRSCHAIGKDWIAARVALWFLYHHAPSIVLTTGPTDRQVRGILWKEIGLLHPRTGFPGALGTQSLRLSRDWFCWGFTAPSKDPDRFQGFHEKNVLVIIDEASGVSEEIYTAIESILSSENTRKLEIGNPTNPASTFAMSFNDPGVHKIAVSAFQTPNFTAFGITEEDILDGSWERKVDGPLPYPSLITPRWVARRAARWGVDSPAYSSRIKAEFPSEDEHTLIPLQRIEAAYDRPTGSVLPVELGVDVARSGADSSVAVLRRGGTASVVMRKRHVNTMGTVAAVLAVVDKYKDIEAVKVDVIGIGAGVYDRLRELQAEGRFDAKVLEANAAAKANNPDKFANARAEWFWNLRTLYEEQRISTSAKDEDLAGQLSNIRWRVNSSGKTIIEPKEDIKKRTGVSPDDADALAIAFSDLQEKVPMLFF